MQIFSDADYCGVHVCLYVHIAPPEACRPLVRSSFPGGGSFCLRLARAMAKDLNIGIFLAALSDIVPTVDQKRTNFLCGISLAEG